MGQYIKFCQEGDDGFEIEFEVSTLREAGRGLYESMFADRLSQIDDRLEENDLQIEEKSREIDRLTNLADLLDYLTSVGIGLVAGLIDVLWVGEFSRERGIEWSNQKTNSFVKYIAKKLGFEGDDLDGAIEFLEKNFGAPSDSVTSVFGGGFQHHLRDFAHHPTLFGLIFSLLTQFTGKAYGTDTAGSFMVVEVKNKAWIGEDLPQKILFGAVFWFFHLVSDMAGSSSNPGAGTGIPGPLLALAKELSALPFFKNLKIGDNTLPVWISKLFNGTLLAKRDENGKILEAVRFDLRMEIGVAYEAARQAVTLVVNECLVRGFYFVRRLCDEIKAKNVSSIRDLKRIDFNKTLPFNNRTITRMFTISTGTLVAVDMLDAVICGAMNSGGNTAVFAKEFALRVNFVGTGRFLVTTGTDIAMGIKRSRLRNERITLYCQQLHLLNAKIFYKLADTWVAAETAEEAVDEAYEIMMKSLAIHFAVNNDITESLFTIDYSLDSAELKNPGLSRLMAKTLKGRYIE